MKLRVKKIDGEEFVIETKKELSEIYEELTDTSGNNFILFGERIEQKMTIESIVKEQRDA